jgi:cadherin domain-containing protein/Big-like domain-containing protein
MPISTLDLNGSATGTDATTTFNEQKAVQLFSSATITSSGGTAGRVDSITLSLQGATATESLGLDATGLSTAAANGIVFNYSAGTLTLTCVNASDAIWQSILRHIIYNNTSDTPTDLTRTVTVVATDSNSGSSLTRTDTINVFPVNDAPVVDLNGATNGTSTTVSYTENDAVTVIAPSAIVTGIDSSDFNGGSLRVAFAQNGTSSDQLSIMTDAAVSMAGTSVSVNGTVIGTVSGGSNGSDLVVSFNSSATTARVAQLLQHIGYSNSSDAPSTAARTVKFTVIDGDGTALGGQDTGVATATINVTAANDRPVANNVVGNGNEDANSIAIKLTWSDVDGTVTSFKVTGALPDASQGTLYTDSAMTNAVVVGTTYAASSANALTLYFKPTANYNGTVTFNYTVTDNSGAEVVASATATINVAFVNDAPKIISNGGTGSVTLSVLENTTWVTTVQATDVETSNLTYSIVGGTDAAKFEIDASTGALTFKAAPDFEAPADTLVNNSYMVKVQASDGSLVDTQTITVKVKNINEAPVVDLNGVAAPGNSATLAYSASNPLKVIAPSATVADVDSPNFNGGSLRVSFTENGTTNDQLAIKTDATVTLSGSTVKIGGTTIGTVAGGANGADLAITFTNNNATSARVTTLLEHIGYSNSSSNPPTSTKIVNFALVDGDGGSQDTGIASATIDVTGTNTPAVMAQSATVTLNENVSGPLTVATLSAIDADASDNTNGSFNGSFQFAAGGADNNKFQIVGNALQYIGPALNFENGADQHSFAVKVQANDGESLSNVQTLTVTLHDVNEAPTAVSFANATTA